MTQFLEEIKNRLVGKKKTIVLPEGTDIRVLKAAVQLQEEGIVKPLVLGDPVTIAKIAEEEKIDSAALEIINPETVAYFEELVAELVARREGKTSEEQAREWLTDMNYFGTMLVYTKRADGLVSGAVNSTADTVRPALQIIRTREGVSKTSGAFIMMKGDEKLVFADCAITINPTAQELGEIAVESAKTAEAFGITPKVAMLSFSTKGSAVCNESQKVVEAAQIAQQLAPHLTIEGEFQFDTAYVPSIASKKAPQSAIQGDATVFVFPTLDAGNIGYKLTERLGGYEALGPILQGLNAPVNDLSRGCSTEDVYKLSLITAVQSIS